ncbi:uncharacterized protein LOC142519275 [Primulina tabacum]|uniref:uncharacterized protein LOC142519275 n=1 Tax=Primulina tabacum TaxID=48773 RepID=UPI003F59DCD7
MRFLKSTRFMVNSVLRNYDPKTNPREVVEPFLGFVHSAPGNAVWKRKADAAFLKFTTLKSFFEETLVAILDYVLDSPLTETPLCYSDTFASSKSRLPPPYSIREEMIYP